MAEERKQFKRNKYYYGKLMTVQDFSSEQSYLNEKRWLINQHVLGWGVVYGLDVRPKDAQSSNSVIVAPGLAIDRDGREILVSTPQEIPLPPGQPGQEPEKFSIGIAFDEIETDEATRPPIANEREEQREYNSIEERFKLSAERVVPESEKDARLILAEVTRTSPASRLTINFSGRRLVHTYPALLGDAPRIIQINWPHDGELKESDFIFGEKAAIVVHFDRKMDHATLNAQTFLLLLKVENKERETFKYEHIPGTVVPHDDNDRNISYATFLIDAEWQNKALDRMHHQKGKFELMVILKGDFVLSVEEDGTLAQALDGNFIGGKLPSGNGIQGGDFVSWFSVKPPEQ